MITDRDMYIKANRISDALEAKVKDGTATPAERERYRTIVDHVLIWEWWQEAQQEKPAAETIPPHPDARRFAEWYRRNEHRGCWRVTDWIEAWFYWSAPQRLTHQVELDEVERALAIITEPTLRAA